MDEDMAQLARRAVACKGWRWMPGALALLPPLEAGGPARRARLVSGWREGLDVFVHLEEPRGGSDGLALLSLCDAAPVLDDPATLGCLLALVQEACGGGAVSIDRDHPHAGHVERPWLAYISVPVGWRFIGRGETLAAALVVALEGPLAAAPVAALEAES